MGPTRIEKLTSVCVCVCVCEQIAQLVFKGMTRLNRIQSIVFETAYNTNENLLICAPTGAGKTNIAMLAVLHEIRQHLHPGGIRKEFKVRTHTHTETGSDGGHLFIHHHYVCSV